MGRKTDEETRLDFIQRNIASQTDELLKMTRYAGSLLEAAGLKDGDSDKNDVDCIMIQIVFYIAVYENFVHTVSKLAGDVRKCIERADGDLSDERKRSARLSATQAEQMEASAKVTLGHLRETEDVLKEYTGAKKQEKYAEEAAGLREFRRKLLEAGKD